MGYEDSVKSLNAHAEYVAHVSGVIILESAERKESDVFFARRTCAPVPLSSWKEV